ncbi:MAG: haloacid dehalogenase-like hydrolase [Waterburya sp.]
MAENQEKTIITTKQPALDLLKNATADTPIILDFDETLFLHNSTAEYINSLRPRLIGFLLLIFLKLIRPWNWLPYPFRGIQIRDWFLVTIPTILLPWTLPLWRKKAQKLAEDYVNTELLTAVNQNPLPPIIVASLGFNFIINPILQHLPLRHDLMVGCRFWQGAKDRGKGKLLMLQEALSDSKLQSAIVITDSEDDLPLLHTVAQPCLIIWPLAKYIPPFQDILSFLKRGKSEVKSTTRA